MGSWIADKERYDCMLLKIKIYSNFKRSNIS
jgi:hypothetical protein